MEPSIMLHESKNREAGYSYINSIWGTKNRKWSAVPTLGPAGGIIVLYKYEFFLIGKRQWLIYQQKMGFEPRSAVQHPQLDYWMIIVLPCRASLTKEPFFGWGGDSKWVWVIVLSLTFLMKNRCGSRITQSMRGFDEFLSSCHLRDILLHAARFT